MEIEEEKIDQRTGSFFIIFCPDLKTRKPMHLRPGHFGPVTEGPRSTLLDGLTSTSFTQAPGSSLTEISQRSQPRPHQQPPTSAPPCQCRNPR